METEKPDGFPGLPEEFVRQNAKYMRLLQGFRLLDDDFMSKVFEDKNVRSYCCISFWNAAISLYKRFMVNTASRIFRGAPSVWIFWRLTRRGNTTILRSSGRTRARTHAVPDTTAAS